MRRAVCSGGTMLMLALLAVAAARAGDSVLRAVDLAAAAADADATHVERMEGEEVLRAESAGAATVVPLFVVDEPGVTATSYALTGEIRYGEVGGTGYLEMWSVFPEGARYFSRTLGAQGPMAALSGSSDGWRPWRLPFDLGDSGLVPERLEVNVALPEGGWIELRAVRLVETSP